MKLQRLLVPIDVAKRPVEVFAFVNGFACNSEAIITLLHVVNLNVFAVENRIYQSLCDSALQHLTRLAAEFMPPNATARLRVRRGKPAEEIVAQAREDQADLIVLAAHEQSFWGRLLAPIGSKITERVIHDAPCSVFVLRAAKRFGDAWPWKDSYGMPKNSGLSSWVVEKTNSRFRGISGDWSRP